MQRTAGKVAVTTDSTSIRLQFYRATAIRRHTSRPKEYWWGGLMRRGLNKYIGQRDCGERVSESATRVTSLSPYAVERQSVESTL